MISDLPAQVSVVSSGVGSAGTCLGRELAESRASPPQITSWMATYMQPIGTDARLVCRAHGPGTLEVFWMGPNDEESLHRLREFRLQTNK